MNRIFKITLIVLLVLAALAPLSAAPVTTSVPLPADLQGELDGQPYRIRIPANWNGTLLVYSYGYAEGYDLVPLTPLGAQIAGADEQMLLDKGYALAGIRAAGWVIVPGGMAAAGWNMKERIQSQGALTSFFRDAVGQPLRTITWGKSMGGLVALALIEKHPGLFDGAVPLCALAAGTPRAYDNKLDILVAFKAAFGWKDEWGTPGALRPGLNVMTEVVPYVFARETADWPKAFASWEFLRTVTHLPLDYPTFYKRGPKPMGFRYQVIWLAFGPLADLEQRAGGRAVENVGRVYSLTPEEIEQLVALGNGLTNEGPEQMLAEMNEEVLASPITADPNARNYAEHYYTPAGRISRPVLTLHTTGDAAAIPQNEAAYLGRVSAEGNEALLMQQFSIGDGVANTHCTFAPAQYLAAIDAMVDWLETGEKPDPATYFPETLGFDPNYVPEPWPW